MQWETQNSPWPQKASMSDLQLKNMLLCIFDLKGIVHYELIAQGQTVTQQCYSEEKTQTLA
jgi:hypothetical protein